MSFSVNPFGITENAAINMGKGLSAIWLVLGYYTNPFTYAQCIAMFLHFW